MTIDAPYQFVDRLQDRLEDTIVLKPTSVLTEVPVGLAHRRTAAS